MELESGEIQRQVENLWELGLTRDVDEVFKLLEKHGNCIAQVVYDLQARKRP